MINAAIIGLGRWGQNLVNSVQGKSSHIRFVAGAVRTPERVQEYADSQGLRLYDDYRKMLADPGIDAIVLATPHSIHAELIIAAAKAGKHVFTEKPFTLTTESAREAVRACTKAGVTLAVGYNWRFQPALQEIRRMLDDGRLGKLLHIEGNFCGPSVYWYPKDHWRQKKDEGPGGGMTGRGVHVVDAMLYLAGHADTVYSQSFRRALDYGIDDTTSMLFRFKGGASGYLGTFIATAETWRMQVFGSKGWVQVGDVEHLQMPAVIDIHDPAVAKIDDILPFMIGRGGERIERLHLHVQRVILLVPVCQLPVEAGRAMHGLRRLGMHELARCHVHPPGAGGRHGGHLVRRDVVPALNDRIADIDLGGFVAGQRRAGQ